MGFRDQLAKGALPVGSVRREKVVTAARSVGLLGAAKPTDYERWVERVEPHLWSPIDLSNVPADQHPHLHLTVMVEPTSEPADVTATTISLSDQSWTRWTARLLVSSAAPPETVAAAQRAVTHEARLSLQLGDAAAHSDAAAHHGANAESSVVDVEVGPQFDATIDAGTTFSRQSFGEIALVAVDPQSDAIVADADSVSLVAGRREHPLLLTSLYPDLIDQYDISSAFLIRRRGTEGRSVAELVASGRVALVKRIVAHRKRTQPPQLGLRPAAVGDDVRTGTRVRHRVVGSPTATIVVRDPLTDSRSAASHLRRLLADAGREVNVRGEALVERSGANGLVVPNITTDVVVIVDGGTLPQERWWLDDLVGACLRSHVLAVAPLIVSPSGVAFDAGVREVDIDETPVRLSARSGRLDIPPFELARVTPVPSLSGRVVVLRAEDVNSLDSLTSRSLRELSLSTNRSNLVWAHQRWTVEASLGEVNPLTPGMAAWNVGRIGRWFDTDVIPHQPAVWRVGEGVW